MISKRVRGHRRRGKRAWIGLALYVAIYDYWAITNDNETLSEAFGKSMEHPIGRWPTLLTVLGLLKHLLAPRWLPQLDPFATLAARWRRNAHKDLY